MIYDKPTGEVFASEANTGENAEFPDIRRGWGITKEQTASKPPMSWMNGAFKRIDENLEYLRQRGIAQWDEKLTYPANACAQHNGLFWQALSENTGKEPGTNESWERWALTKQEVESLVTNVGDAKLAKSANLSDLTNVAEALKNLGLGELALSPRFLVSKGENANGWYEIYSDGWKRLGRNINWSNAITTSTPVPGVLINYPISFTNTPYFVSAISLSTLDNGLEYCSVASVTLSTITISSYSNTRGSASTAEYLSKWAGFYVVEGY